MQTDFTTPSIYSVLWGGKHFRQVLGKKFSSDLPSANNILSTLVLQYDQVIIERTIGLVLGPSTALYEQFLKHCTLTNKAVGTI